MSQQIKIKDRVRVIEGKYIGAEGEVIRVAINLKSCDVKFDITPDPTFPDNLSPIFNVLTIALEVLSQKDTVAAVSSEENQSELKFKFGDRVRVIAGIEKGTVKEINTLTGIFGIRIDGDEKGHLVTFYDYELELLPKEEPVAAVTSEETLKDELARKFKVGDRLKVIKGDLTGATGVLKEIGVLFPEQNQRRCILELDNGAGLHDFWDNELKFESKPVSGTVIICRECKIPLGEGVPDYNKEIEVCPSCEEKIRNSPKSVQLLQARDCLDFIFYKICGNIADGVTVRREWGSKCLKLKESGDADKVDKIINYINEQKLTGLGHFDLLLWLIEHFISSVGRVKTKELEYEKKEIKGNKDNVKG
ncbi:MAG: hypothetical protein PHX21_13585 [bacterium]|nr:hypothetical protein [bacterium]